MGSTEKELLWNTKASKDICAIVEDSFEPGTCECIRCKVGGKDNSSYQQRHTFEINGEALRRRFAKCSYADLFLLLKKLWMFAHNKEIKPGDRLSVDSVLSMVQPESREKFLVLAQEVSMVVVEGEFFKLLPQPEVKVEKINK